MRYVIIGNSAAGVFAAEEIRKIDKAGSVDILSAEQYPVYARCLTSYFLSGQLAEARMFIRPANFYSRNSLVLHCGETASQVDATGRKVVTESGREFPYDKLLLACGSSPVLPAIPGIKSRGVFTLRTLDDAKAIREYAESGKRAVIVGGGFVALKAAYALLGAGLKVACVVTSSQILSQALDKEGADLAARALTAHGLTLKYHNDASEILSMHGKVHGLKLSGGEELAADLVIIGKGVRPNVEFLQSSGVELDQGVLVDEFLQTSLPDVYAAGDAAQGFDSVSGSRRINALWPNAAEQGKAAGRNMAGHKTRYDGSLAMNSVDFFGLSVIAAGQAKAEGDGFEVVKLQTKDKYRRLVFKEDRLAGYILVGDTAKAGILTELVRARTPLGKAREDLVREHSRQKLLW